MVISLDGGGGIFRRLREALLTEILREVQFKSGEHRGLRELRKQQPTKIWRGNQRFLRF